MNKKRINQIFLLLIVMLLFAPFTTSARPQYAVKESKNCDVCHASDGPPQLNDIGIYYATHNYSLAGYVAPPKLTPTPTDQSEIGVHMNTWDVGLRVIATILLILVVVFAIRL